MANGVWTNNYEGIKRAMALGGAVCEGWSTVKRTTGAVINSVPLYCPTNSLHNSITGVSGTYNTVMFGTGTATPAASDVDLTGHITEGLSLVSNSSTGLTRDDETHTQTNTFKVVIQRTASAPVTITEWGLFTQGSYTSGSNTYTAPVLVYHALLDTPVTLNQYESATFTCTVSLTLTDPW